MEVARRLWLSAESLATSRVTSLRGYIRRLGARITVEAFSQGPTHHAAAAFRRSCVSGFRALCFTDPSGCHIVKIAPTPPTFRAFITLNRLGQTVFSHLDQTAALEMAKLHIDGLLDRAL